MSTTHPSLTVQTRPTPGAHLIVLRVEYRHPNTGATLNADTFYRYDHPERYEPPAPAGMMAAETLLAWQSETCGLLADLAENGPESAWVEIRVEGNDVWAGDAIEAFDWLEGQRV